MEYLFKTNIITNLFPPKTTYLGQTNLLFVKDAPGLTTARLSYKKLFHSHSDST